MYIYMFLNIIEILQIFSQNGKVVVNFNSLKITIFAINLFNNKLKVNC